MLEKITFITLSSSKQIHSLRSVLFISIFLWFSVWSSQSYDQNYWFQILKKNDLLRDIAWAKKSSDYLFYISTRALLIKIKKCCENIVLHCNFSRNLFWINWSNNFFLISSWLSKFFFIQLHLFVTKLTINFFWFVI